MGIEMKVRYYYQCNRCGYKVDDKIEVEKRNDLVGKQCVSCKKGRYFREQADPLVKFKGEGWTDDHRN